MDGWIDEEVIDGRGEKAPPSQTAGRRWTETHDETRREKGKKKQRKQRKEQVKSSPDREKKRKKKKKKKKKVKLGNFGVNSCGKKGRKFKIRSRESSRGRSRQTGK